jgi:hypothetical protein
MALRAELNPTNYSVWSIHPNTLVRILTAMAQSARPVAFGGEFPDPPMRQDYRHVTTHINSFLLQSGTARRTPELRSVLGHAQTRGRV